MDILFIHPNFPGQFRQLAAYFVQQPNTRVFAVGDATWVADDAPIEGVALMTYATPETPADGVHRYNRSMDTAVRRAEAVKDLLLAQKRLGFEPEVIITHPGWGDAFFIKELFPMTPVIGFFEFFYHPRGADVGFDPEFPSGVDDIFRLKILNTIQLLALESCDVRISPTHWQKGLFPKAYQASIQVVHEGVDVARLLPNPEAKVHLANGSVLTRQDEVLTFVSRSLEPYRGYHQFMRALPAILAERPQCQVLIVGNHDVSYGPKPRDGVSYQEKYWREVAPRCDTSRVHFLGSLPYDDYLSVLSISRAHVYLTYPFVLSWSAMEAMALGCTLIASDTTPVREVMRHNENALLVPFFDTQQLSESVISVLASPERFRSLGQQARQDILSQYDAQQGFAYYHDLVKSLV
ncbi:MAG: glycosyltransferase [Gammaproteobacteria bacterium]|nr:glycosyltransferase [Gammaproteobacteria bacterium]